MRSIHILGKKLKYINFVIQIKSIDRIYLVKEVGQKKTLYVLNYHSHLGQFRLKKRNEATFKNAVRCSRKIFYCNE